MIVIRTFPGTAGFERFIDCIDQCYTLPEQRARKRSEHIPVRHLDACFVVLDKEMPVARAAVYRNAELQYRRKTTVCIGGYECIRDEEVAVLLLTHIETYVRELSAGCMIGPMNGSTWEQYRFADRSSEPDFFTEPLQQSYYVKQWEACGWDTIAGYRSGSTSDFLVDKDIIAGVKERLGPLGIQLRPLNLTAYREELIRIHPFLQRAFAQNFLYTPVALHDFLDKYLPLGDYLKEELVLVAEDVSGAVVGVFLCIDDLYDMKNKTLIIKTVARDPAPRFSGLGHLMAAEVYRKAAGMGYTRLIHAFMFDEGTSADVSVRFNGQLLKTYRLLGKML